MNASFGIDHPLIATNDIEALRERLIAMGFNMTAIGKHPWGTSTSLAMFNGCLIEIMGIYDKTLIDEIPAGDFRFGRHVYEHLQQREGVALSALHSTDSMADAARAIEAGFTVAGHLEFGRDVELPNGDQGRTKTTLALMPDPDFPRLSFFLCQQHRPDLIYVPEWLVHPNSVNGINGITILAAPEHHSALKQKLSNLYGPTNSIHGGFQVLTANGPMRIQSIDALEAEFESLPVSLYETDTPSIIAMDLVYTDPKKFSSSINNCGVEIYTTASGAQSTRFEDTGNVALRFYGKPTV